MGVGVGRRQQREFDNLDEVDYHSSGDGNMVDDDDDGGDDGVGGVRYGLQSKDKGKKTRSRWGSVLQRVKNRADLYSTTTTTTAGVDGDLGAVDLKKSRRRKIHPTAA